MSEHLPKTALLLMGNGGMSLEAGDELFRLGDTFLKEGDFSKAERLFNVAGDNYTNAKRLFELAEKAGQME